MFPFDNMAHVDHGGIISRGFRVSAPQSQTRFRAQGITLRFRVLFCSLGLNPINPKPLNPKPLNPKPCIVEAVQPQEFQSLGLTFCGLGRRANIGAQIITDTIFCFFVDAPE